MNHEQGRSIADRIQTIEDERDIVQVLYAYGRALDYGPLESFLDVFEEDGRWERVASKLPPKSFEKHSGLEKMWTVHTHAPDYFHKHTVLNPIVEVDGDEAHASSYLVFICDHPDGPYIRAFSRCQDWLVRSVDRKWRIRERRAELESWSSHNYPPPPWQGLPAIVE